ncbi:pseudaminic acid cytidylyltransferase [Sporomusa sphaeroides]|uniref:CMP-N,N'-diacetyllegionaminic acid synthase n=1 Tax=Sporomusa sphaeroides DSM 2875 TaxID=1337886 RepID=A0ABM9W436_9FIRM|nr:pseudaminic acid cytidylyltransferase [Sporomusa sphaeroides]OLS55575.1 CMP-N,N'-diacetyllegionaminic acid synthase [Sporomusa sphaeroides DSM 2875]CVK19888.1 CMP-N,N'-diacetyllegionaminic acid synthase [Sporomusa sphaeroides DSM 2875]
MSSIAIITARGGSKRIPRKNIKEFCGQPILAYSIQAALESKLFNEVMVSTDDKEIAEVALAYGAKVPFYRSEKTSDDYATTADVLREVLEEYKKIGKTYEWMCCIYPTAPFVTAAKLQAAFTDLQAAGADALVPVVKFTYPPQRCFVIKNNKLVYKWPEYTRARSQDLEPFFHDAGQYYFVKTKIFEDKLTLFPEGTIPYLLDEMAVQDIDTIDDWKIAEIKYQAMKTKAGGKYDSFSC